MSSREQYDAAQRIDWFIPEGNRYITVSEDTPCGVCGTIVEAGRQGIYDNHGRLCGYSCNCDLGTPSELDRALEAAWEERSRVLAVYWRKNKALRKELQALTTALFSMARRAAYWRWAYRDARSEAEYWEDEARYRGMRGDQWKESAYAAERRESAYYAALYEVASHDCLYCHPSSCIETDRAVEFCAPCIGRSALEWSRDLGWSR